MLAYFGNIFGMLGVALIATAFFKNDWQAGIITGCLAILFGALFYGLSLPIPKRGKNESVLLSYGNYDLSCCNNFLDMGATCFKGTAGI